MHETNVTIIHPETNSWFKLQYLLKIITYEKLFYIRVQVYLMHNEKNHCSMHVAQKYALIKKKSIPVRRNRNFGNHTEEEKTAYTAILFKFGR